MRPLFPLAAAALALAIAGCTPPDSNAPASPPPGGSSANAPANGTANATLPPPVTGTVKLAMMPKGKGIAYFTACQKGAERAAKELGDVDLTFEGPQEAKSEAQSAMIDTWVVRKFDAIAVACNDPDQIAPSLARAKDAGARVFTYDADANAQSSGRIFFVNQASSDDIAHALVDEMAAQTGPEAMIGTVSSDPNAPNQAAWWAAMKSYQAQKYPKMTLLEPEFAGEDQVKSRERAENIMKARPDVKGIFGLTSMAFPGAAQAVQAAGKGGQVAVVGLGLPSTMKQFVDSGVVKTVILWNPEDLGYLTVEVARAVSKGELKPGDPSFKSKLGEKTINGDVVLLGPPMRFTKENIAQFKF